jgi:DinB superfamily
LSPETVEQYKHRIMGYLGNQDPLRIQGTRRCAIAHLIKGAKRAKLARRPAPDKWSVSEILAHLSDAELVAGHRMRRVLGAPGSPIPAFDQDRWAAEDYAKQYPALSLHVFRSVRECKLVLLRRLKREQWKQFGVHAERG